MYCSCGMLRQLFFGSVRKIFLRSRDGQATVEYVAVLLGVMILFGSFLPGQSDDPSDRQSVFSLFATTMENKYKSYCFGVAISDPPSEKFDEQVDKDADYVKHILEILKKIFNLSGGTEGDDMQMPPEPGLDGLVEFSELVE